jgi:hypothetical protein
MEWILYVISILLIALGSVTVIYTPGTMRVAADLYGKVGARLMGLLPLLFGVLLAAGAGHSRHFWPVMILGILGMIKGFFFLLGPSETVDGLMKTWFLETSEPSYRLAGLIWVILGVALISWI